MSAAPWVAERILGGYARMGHGMKTRVLLRL